MNRFHKLTIENFQSHKFTEIEFSDGLNVFVGPSDSGKSAILRALRWVLMNIPRGQDFIYKGAKQCRVVLTMLNGTQITRVRGGSINRYILTLPDEEEQIFEGFGNTVPDEIKQVHQIEALKIDQELYELHFSKQLESPFLLFDSPQSKAKVIGRISGAHLIDQARKKTGQDRLAIQQETKHLFNQMNELEQKLEPYQILPSLEKQLEKAEQKYNQVHHFSQVKESYQALFHRLQKVEQEKHENSRIMEQLKQIPQLQSDLKKVENQYMIYRQLKRLNLQYRRVLLDKDRCDQTITRTKNLPVIEQGIDEIIEKKNRLLQLKQLHQRNQLLLKQKAHITQKWIQLKEIPKALEVVPPIENTIFRLKKLMLLHTKYENWMTERQEHLSMVNRYQHVKRVTNVTLPTLEEKQNQLRRLNELSARWADMKWRLQKGKKYCKERKTDIERLTAEWADILTKRGTCPTCGTMIDDQVMTHIMEEINGGSTHGTVGRKD
ncbi:AAA family ATPase [Hazenella sp. IB182357]|uniref:Nuclease SbcCD subunit C n=1 Tax=Polycladospora coralii TaxID=2771432 RepID=A0A926NH14_9BACL|nr:AAA family ATPase [Polycladospora coralii]MBD1373188.1 AAA family ATPase [Polycladospora coralii]